MKHPFSPPDPDDPLAAYEWPPDELVLSRFESYLDGGTEPLRKPPAEGCPPFGHSSGDPGPDRTYRISFEIPEFVSRDSVAVFQLALQEQGGHEHRLAALDQAAYRARANGDISAAAYRLYEVARVASKGKHRCCLWDLDKIGFFAGGIDRARASKLLPELEAVKLVVILKFTEGRLGAPSARKLFIAPAVTAEDRMQGTADRIEADAEAAKVAALKKRAEAARKLYHREREEPLVSPATIRDSSFTGDNEKGFLVVKNEFSSFTGDNTLKHKSNSRERKGTDAPSPADAGEPPLDLNSTHQGDRPPVASSPSPQAQPSRSTSNGEHAAQPFNGSAAPTDFDRFWDAFPPGRKIADAIPF